MKRKERHTDMRKWWTTWLSILTTTSLLIGTTSVVYADKLSDIKKKEQSVEQQQASTKSQLNALNQQATVLKGQVDSIQAQITKLDDTITNTQISLQQRQKQIDALKAEIAQTQTKIDAQYQVLEQRVRVMYEDGSTSYLDVLFSATSFADLLDRLQLLSMIAAQDKRILQGIESDKSVLEQSSQKLMAAQSAQQKMVATLSTEKSQQVQKQSQEQGLLKQVTDQKMRDQLEFKSESDALNNLKSDLQQILAQQSAYETPSGWTWPVPSEHTISSPYGYRSFDGGGFHDGIDIPGPVGTPIVAATAGRVLLAGPASGFGDWIVIQSAGGLLEIYGHMYSYEIKVHPGEVVREGQQIAGIGSNGFSTGPHLHFTIATGFDSAGFPVSVNPTKYVHP